MTAVCVGTQLKFDGYLEEEAFRGGLGCTVSLTSKTLSCLCSLPELISVCVCVCVCVLGKGKHWLREPHSLKLVPNRDMLSADKPPPSNKPRCLSCTCIQWSGSPPPLLLKVSSCLLCRSSYLPSSQGPTTSSDSSMTSLSFLPSSSGAAASSGPVAVEYLPTMEQRDCYDVIEVERVVATPTPAPPPKDQAITRLEVECFLEFFHACVGSSTVDIHFALSV